MLRSAAQNRELTFEARGVLAYILSKPDDWKVQPSDLEQQCKKSVVYRVLAELIKHGYIERTQERNDKKQIIAWHYLVHEYPLPRNQEVALQEVAENLLPKKLEVAKLEVEKTDITEYREEQKIEISHKTEKDSIAPKGDDKPITPPKKVKPSKYTPEENNAISALLKAWQETAQNIQPFAYQNRTFREQAHELHKLNVTPELVTVYLNNLRLDKFWRDKGISWNKVCSEIIPWLKARHRLLDPVIAKNATTEIIDDGPTEPVENPVLFGGQREPAA
jgi:hypothetical protein